VGSRRDCTWILGLSGFRVVAMAEAALGTLRAVAFDLKRRDERQVGKVFAYGNPRSGLIGDFSSAKRRIRSRHVESMHGLPGRRAWRHQVS